MIKSDSSIIERVEQIASSPEVQKLKPQDSNKENICLAKIDRIEKKFPSMVNKKTNINRLKFIAKEIQDTAEYVVSAYPESLPKIISDKLFKLYNYETKILILLNEKIKDENQKNVAELTVKYEKSFENFSSQLNGMWGNIISLILSFSIVTTLVEAVDKIESSYILIFALIVIWFGMTLLVFFGGLFRTNSVSSKECIFIYSLISVLLVVAISLNIFYSSNRGYLTDYVKTNCEISSDK